MTDTIEQKALALLNEVCLERKEETLNGHYTRSNHRYIEALCRAIERDKAFRQEVSDAVELAVDACGHDGLRKAYIHSRFFHFIIAKPDPLAEAIKETHDFDDYDFDIWADQLRAAIEKRGGKIVWDERL